MGAASKLSPVESHKTEELLLIQNLEDFQY